MFILVVSITALLIVSSICWEIYVAKGTQRDVNFTVNNLVVKNSQNNSKYLVFTSQGVFQDTDSLFNGKFNSSDVYGNLKIGRDYTCRVYGFRIPFLSTYPNILRCK